MSTRALAKWIAGLRHADVPPAVREKIADAIFDTLGCALYGAATPWAVMVREWAAEAQPRDPRGGASIWGSPDLRVRAADAALANGVAAHAFELDDYHNVKIHPGAPVIPAAIALGERIDANGVDLITAVAAGYETMIRTAAAIGPLAGRLRGWHLTGVCGTLGAAAACASLLDLNEEHTAWALGLAGTQSAGLFAFNADGAMSKRLHPGRSAQAGVFAAELAARGFTGPTQVYETADGGLLSTMSGSQNVAALTHGLGTQYLSEEINFKPYSCCGSTHAYIDAALALRERAAVPIEGATIRAGIAQAVRVQCGFDYEPRSVMFAQMSLRFVIALALVEGAALPAQFTAEKIKDPRVVKIAQQMELVDDPAMDALYPVHMAGWVSLEHSGKRDRVEYRDPLGSNARPMDREALRRKSRILLEATHGPERLSALERIVDTLESSRVRDLAKALCVEAMCSPAGLAENTT